MNTSLKNSLANQGNDHAGHTREFELKTGIPWHQTVPHGYLGGRRLSVILPAHNVAYCLPDVLDALDAQTYGRQFEVIVVDDASTDTTAKIIATHPVVTTGIRLPARHGAATARNLGTFVAQGETVLYVDADMALPPHTVADLAARATDHAVLTGFRHNLPHRAAWPATGPELAADHRVTWRPPAHTRLLYSGITLHEPVDGRPLEHTRDFRDLGYGRTYYDWDLPRMVVTALLAAPRAAVVDIGGFDAEFGRIGWGMEDTYLGACLIAAGLLVIPLRQAVGFHLDPPDAAEQWQHKLRGWVGTLAHYRALLNAPAPSMRLTAFSASMNTLLHSCEVLR
ncbi:glycosyltransferase family 2 protein [Amycolatopsis sp. K13G38]|uniref:Glycosyltransferase family 2 protein n=1 Tax=Amycolatopsis acididurans TaxID=2724524 RepID=A0ABX1J774_9PSEU|nr:glycosyltransferase family 2 protein [Amycolatopsis acididurans]NKQ55598.1 glycosyltransferase family 2 protein [Amycolatopsis acididurans]